MATRPSEFVTVALRAGSYRGVHYATDPESGWVSVVVPGAPPRLLVVRPELVSFSGETCPDAPVLLRGARRDVDGFDAADVAADAPTAAEMAAALERRGMDAQVVDAGVRLLDGAVEISHPFGERDVRSRNETILARIAPLLREIHDEIKARRNGAASASGGEAQ